MGMKPRPDTNYSIGVHVETSPGFWRSLDEKIRPISDLGDSHLCNIKLLLLRVVKKGRGSTGCGDNPYSKRGEILAIIKLLEVTAELHKRSVVAPRRSIRRQRRATLVSDPHPGQE